MAAQKQHFTRWTLRSTDLTGPADFMSSCVSDDVVASQLERAVASATVTGTISGCSHAKDHKEIIQQIIRWKQGRTCSIADVCLKSGVDGDLMWY